MSADERNPRVTHRQPRSDELPAEAQRERDAAEADADLNDPQRAVERSERQRTGQDE